MGGLCDFLVDGAAYHFRATSRLASDLRVIVAGVVLAALCMMALVLHTL